jgi:hypothetical protein
MSSLFLGHICAKVLFMTKTTTKGIRLNEDTWDLLKEIAEVERRSISEMARFCIEDHLELIEAGLDIRDRDKQALLVEICALPPEKWAELGKSVRKIK